ncbi:MAG: hypothetical protein WC616_01555 [Candidatus Omnitrophota bacterium]
MYIEVNFSSFCDAFNGGDREGNFSYAGKKALFEYLESLEEDTSEMIELDVVALCGEYAEYADFAELQKNYDVESMKELEENTTVIKIDSDSFIIQSY